MKRITKTIGIASRDGVLTGSVPEGQDGLETVEKLRRERNLQCIPQPRNPLSPKEKDECKGFILSLREKK